MARAAYLRRFLRETVLDAPLRTTFVILLMTLASVFEGTALAMLFPLLSLVGLGSESEIGDITDKINAVLAVYGIAMNIYTAAALFVAMTLLQHIFFLAQNWFAAGFQSDMVKLWRCRLMDALLKCEWSYFSRQNTGELIHVVTVETGRASYLVSHGTQVISLVLTALVYLAVAFVTSWQVTLMLVACGLAIIGLTQLCVRGSVRLAQAQADIYKRFTSLSGETLGGMKLIRAADGAETVRGWLWPMAAAMRRLEQRIHIQPALLRSSFEVTAAAALMATLIVGIGVLGTGGVTVLLIAALFVRLYPRISTTQQYVHQFRMALPYYAAVAETLDAAEAAAEPGSAAVAGAPGLMPPPALILDGVSVSYGRRPALRGVTMTVPARETVAIAGPSGAGKSTLVDTLLCLVRHQGGTVEIDGRDLAEIDLASWRRSVGYVPQETFLFNATIGENIAFARPGLPFDEIREAARKAHLLEFIDGLPDGFDTIVGDRGVMLSGGQRQRVGIARALAGGKSLLILDEATAALDSETEAAIVADISALHGEMTIIVIAHRLSTLKTADRIYVLNEGRVVESGTWASLVARQGLFRRLWDMQTEVPDGRRAVN